MVAERPDPCGRDAGVPRVADGGPTRSSPGPESAFEAELAGLEQSGATLLVASTAPREHRVRLCRTMLGADREQDRRRVLALTGSEAGTTGDRLPASASRDPDHLQVVGFRPGAAPGPADSSTGAGEAGSGDGSGAPDSLARTTVQGSSLSSFGIAIAEAVDAMAGDRSALAPQELRVCVDRLDPLLDAFGSEDVQRFVHVLRKLVADNAGLAHLHLPVSPDHPDVSMLAPLCDGLVEVRTRDDGPRYRLSITDGPASEWLPIPEE